MLVGVDAESGLVEGSFGFWVCAFGGGVVVTPRLVVCFGFGFGFVGLVAGNVEFEGKTQLHWSPPFLVACSQGVAASRTERAAASWPRPHCDRVQFS